MLIFENTDYFWLFWFIPVLIIIFIVGRYISGLNLKKFCSKDLSSYIIPSLSNFRPWLKHILLLLAFSSIIIAIINPKIGSRTETATREGVDIIVALDVSRSMLAEDVRPNRLERSKMVVSRLIDNAEGHRIGIVAFAGNAVMQVPLTTDKFAAKMILRTINTNTVSVQGTAIGSAIERAIKSFSESSNGTQVIIVISDGENHLDCPVTSAKKANEKDIVIHTIGVGSEEGAPIPLYKNGEMKGFLRDNQGNTVITRYDELTLRQIAENAKGMFVRGSGADLGIDSVLENINEMQKQTFEEIKFTEYESKYYFFIALALLFIFIEMLIYERKNKYLEKFKLF